MREAGFREIYMDANVTQNRHLKPGYGFLEQVEIDLQPRCDDNSLPEDSALRLWAHYLEDATARAERPIAYNHDTGKVLQEAGFFEIREEVIRVPLNPWPSDAWQREVGRWYNLGFTEGLEALTLGPFTRVLGWRKWDVEKLVGEVKREVCTKRMHVYVNM